MPFKHAQWWVLVLVPLALAAFWQGYFGNLRDAPFAFHLHGLTASAWLVTLIGQSRSAGRRDFVQHRLWGRSSLITFPVFLAGQTGVIQSMAIKAANGHPFYSEFGARLGILDLISAASLAWLFYKALAGRRAVGTHATAMLSTTVFLISPTLGRLMAAIPGVSFPAGVQIGQLVSLGVMFVLWRERGSDRRIVTVISLTLIAQSVLFETLGRTETWSRLYMLLTEASPALVLGFGLMAGVAVTLAGWSSVRPTGGTQAA